MSAEWPAGCEGAASAAPARLSGLKLCQRPREPTAAGSCKARIPTAGRFVQARAVGAGQCAGCTAGARCAGGGVAKVAARQRADLDHSSPVFPELLPSGSKSHWQHDWCQASRRNQKAYIAPGSRAAAEGCDAQAPVMLTWQLALRESNGHRPGAAVSPQVPNVAAVCAATRAHRKPCAPRRGGLATPPPSQAVDTPRSAPRTSPQGPRRAAAVPSGGPKHRGARRMGAGWTPPPPRPPPQRPTARPGARPRAPQRAPAGARPSQPLLSHPSGRSPPAGQALEVDAPAGVHIAR